MHVLILGGSGNISEYVTIELLRRGHEVTIATRGNRTVSAGCRQIIANRDQPEAFRKALSSWKGDVSIDFLTRTPEHAANAYESVRGRVRQHIFISTVSVYDRYSINTLLLTEDRVHASPHWEYPKLKAECERFFLEKHQSEQFPITIVRPFHTVGLQRIPSPIAGPKYTLAARILKDKPVIVHGDGQSLWTITASSDFAAGLAGLVGNERAVGEAFHITHDAALTWNCIVEELGRALGRTPRLVHLPLETICETAPELAPAMRTDMAVHNLFDNAKIKRFVPDFQCKVSFRDYLANCLAWYDEHPSQKKVDEEADRLMDRLSELKTQ